MLLRTKKKKFQFKIYFFIWPIEHHQQNICTKFQFNPFIRTHFTTFFFKSQKQNFMVTEFYRIEFTKEVVKWVLMNGLSWNFVLILSWWSSIGHIMGEKIRTKKQFQFLMSITNSAPVFWHLSVCPGFKIFEKIPEDNQLWYTSRIIFTSLAINI